MKTVNLHQLFDKSNETRKNIIKTIGDYKTPEPKTGSSFFIHLSELCPVACKHCMYSSDLTAKSVKDALNKDDIEYAIKFINDSQSQKLNITGGGEPFLKFGNILRLVESVKTPVVEIVTAGNWARTENRARSVLLQLENARRKNSNLQELRLRLSLDRYHIEAPRPVTLTHYANVARAWSKANTQIGLGYRGIQPDMGIVDEQLATLLGGYVRAVDDCNRVIIFNDNKKLPINFNVMRFSGAATGLQTDKELAENTMSIAEYYQPYEKEPGQLTLATTVNDAIKTGYVASEGVAITLNSDGEYWIFAGTAPDRKLMLGNQTFNESIAHFYKDPITRFLVTDGIWALAELVSKLNRTNYELALVKNDMAFFVEDLLADPKVRLAVTLLVLQSQAQKNEIKLSDQFEYAEILNTPTNELMDLFVEQI